MDLSGKVVVVTGAASGIGLAAAERFAKLPIAGLVLADLDAERLHAVAARTRGVAVPADLGQEEGVGLVVAAAERAFGRIDVYFSNAGIFGKLGGPEVPDRQWEAMWRLHVMAHVWAARAVVEPMLERGGGSFVITASAAGLLNHVESASYGVTKHGAVALAEWLAIAYGNRGLHVGCLCPQAVRTAMVRERGSASSDGILEPDVVAGQVVEAIESERFLILPHPEVLEYFRCKTQDYDRWLGGMQKLHRKMAS